MKPTRYEIGKEVTKWERERERERKKSNHIIHTQKPFIPFFSLHVKAVKIIHFSSFGLLYKQTFIRMHKIFLFFYTVRYIGYLYKNHKYKLLQFNKSLGQLDLWMEPIRHWGIKDTIYTNTSLVHVTCDLGSCTNSKMFEINPMSSSYPERHENNFFFFKCWSKHWKLQELDPKQRFELPIKRVRFPFTMAKKGKINPIVI